MNDKVNIIGAGIGGLSMALTLKQKGLSVNIFESAAEIKPVGAGIILANNAMQIYKKLGLQEKIQKAGNKISVIHVTDHNLKTISKTDLTEFELKKGVFAVAIHRGDLQKILAEELGLENIQFSKRLIKIKKEDFFELLFDDTTIYKSKLIIAADGIHSNVRNQLFNKSSFRNAQQICWRGICELDLPSKYHNDLTESWGKGKRFGFVKISESKVYWYALANSKKIMNDVNLLELFKEFHADILNIIFASKKEQIIVSEIIDLKPIKVWQKENICLIGDAAHATTPNLGQGACQAIEDAYTIGKLLDTGLPLDKTFKEYEKLRLKKAHFIVNTSWRLGKLAHLENIGAISLRNFLLRKLPNRLNKKQLEFIFNIN